MSAVEASIVSSLKRSAESSRNSMRRSTRPPEISLDAEHHHDGAISLGVSALDQVWQVPGASAPRTSCRRGRRTWARSKRRNPALIARASTPRADSARQGTTGEGQKPPTGSRRDHNALAQKGVASGRARRGVVSGLQKDMSRAAAGVADPALRRGGDDETNAGWVGCRRIRLHRASRRCRCPRGDHCRFPSRSPRLT